MTVVALLASVVALSPATESWWGTLPPINRERAYELDLSSDTPGTHQRELEVPLEWGDEGQTWGYVAERKLVVKWPATNAGDTLTVEWGTPTNSLHNLHYWGQSRQPANNRDSRTLAMYSNSISVPGTTDVTVPVTATLARPTLPPQIWTYSVRVRVIGGPFDVRLASKADPRAFDKVLDANDSRVTSSRLRKFEFPWYSTDFNYNPAEFVNNEFRPANAQPQNMFKLLTLWAQPPDTKIWWITSAPGVFASKTPGIWRTVAGTLAYHLTKGLPQTVQISACTRPSTSNAEFTVTAAYAISPGGFSESLPPTGIGAEDHCADFWRKVLSSDPKAHLKTTFRVHRPKAVKEFAPASPNAEPPSSEVIGRAFFYHLVDYDSVGMPGIWVQERWVPPPPGGFLVNNRFVHWTTYRRFERLVGLFGGTFETSLSVDGVFGPDYIWAYSQAIPPGGLTIPGHQYWAGTKNPSVGSVGGYKVGTFTIQITGATVSHTQTFGGSGGGGGGGSGGVP